jgi:plastocyanin
MKDRKRFVFLFLLMVLVLAACGGGDEGVEVEVTAVAVAATATEAPTEEPTAVPTETPVEATEAPTAEPTAAATEEPTAEPVAEPAPARVGIVRFRDSEGVRSGNFELLLEEISPAAAGTHYELWLVDDSSNTLNLGEFVVEGAVNFSGDTAENLLGSYSGAFITVEPDGVADGEIGPVVLNGVIPSESLLHIRHVVTSYPENPDEKAFLIGAEEQLLLAIEHAGLLLEALAGDNLEEAQRHAEHVVNIVDGESGDNYGDLDGDGTAQNPGDGLGVRVYLEGAKEHAQLAADAEAATDEVKLHAGHVQVSSDNALLNLEAAISEAVRVIASDSAAEAQPAADELAGLLALALNGQDANGDGAIAPIENEGGWLTAYEHALNMGSFEFFAAEGSEAVVADDESEPEPTAEGEAPDEAPSAVTVEMVNFVFEPVEVTVAMGTTVTWVNLDSGPQHSATAADGSFDTGLFDSGQEATITFDAPGTFLYYCVLHGTPDGSGMAGTIIVTDG